MCEANIYMQRNGTEELLMEKVDRVIPGAEDNIFMENIFGERKIVHARIKEMELVHHRIILEEIRHTVPAREQEIWLELATDHGHFHAGEAVKLSLYKGYNMTANPDITISDVKIKLISSRGEQDCNIHRNPGAVHIDIGEEVEGLLQFYAYEKSQKELYAKILVEVGHHHHHSIDALGLPLEIVPVNYQHARMGENYEIEVLKNGEPVAGIVVKATYTGTSNNDYPHYLTTDKDGKAKLFLTARGNYLFSVTDDNIISTFTLSKSF